MSDNLQEILERVKAGSRNEADIQAIAAAIASGKLVLANAPRAVGVGGDMTDSQVVPGNKNVIGERNIVIYGADAQTIQAVLCQHSPLGQFARITSVDELVQQVRSHCCEKIQHLYSKIRLLNFQQVNVDQLYVEVYILKQLSNRVNVSIPNLLQGHNLRNDFDRFGLGWRGEKRLPGLEVANCVSRLMVLGRPGAGKSTFLRYLAITCRQEKFLSDHIPVLIELRVVQNASQFNLLDQIQQEFQFTNPQQTHEILDTGRLLLLLDGLDEVADPLRRTVQNQISEFTRKYYKTRIILTCRTQTVEYILPDFECVEVANFNPEQVEIFAQKWFTALADTPQQGAALASRFMTTLRLPEHQRTAELAVTPILLSLACLVFQDAGELPTKRIELYQRGLNLLLEQWDTERGIERTIGGQCYRALDIAQKQALLSYVAIRKHEQKQFALFDQQEIQRYIADYFKRSDQKISDRDSRDVLRAIEAQHGLLVERASQIYSFSHLTFQEFFAAKWFCDPVNRQNLIRYITDTRGQELIRFALEMPAYADDIVQSVKQSIDGLLAADKLQQFLTWIQKKACSVNVPHKSAAVRAFYFALACDRDLARARTRTLAPVLNHINASTLDFDPARDLDLALAHALDLTRDLDLNLDLDLDLDLTRALALACALALARNLDYIDALACDLARARAHAFDPELERVLQALTQQLPNPEKNWNRFQQWWQTYGEAWIVQFRTMMIKYRNIGHEWQFSEEQHALLKQYHDANKRLINWLKSDCEVSPGVRQEIETTLLLPITEIEKCKSERGE